MRRLRLIVIAAVALPGCRTVHDASTASTPGPASSSTVSAQEFSDALAHYSQALLYEHARPPRLADALEHYLAAYRADPTRLEHFLKTAELQYRTGDIHGTVSTMRSAVSYHPQSYDAHIKLAAFSQIAGKPQLASKVCSRAIQIRPNLAMPYARLAFLLLQRDDPVMAMQALDRGLKNAEDPGIVLDTYPHVANVLRASGFRTEANRCLTTVATHRPDNLQVREQLVSSYLQFKEIGKAREALTALTTDTQYHPEGYSVILADLHERVGDSTGAIHFLEEAVAAENPDPKASLRLAILYLQSDRNEETISILERVVGTAEDHPLLYALMGEIYEKLDRHDDAMVAYSRACQYERAGSTPHLRLALLYLRMERRSDATRTLSDARERFPQDTDVPTILGWMHFVVGDHNAAIKHFEEVDKIATELEVADKGLHDMYLFWYASACERNRDYERSEALFRRCIKAQPDNHQAYNYVAYMWAELNQNLQEAQKFVLKALEQDPSNGAYIDTLGWIHYRREEHREAEREIRRALEQMPEDPTILEHLGDVLVALDRVPHARKAWRQSFRLNPSNEDLAKKLREHGIDPEILLRENLPLVETEAGE